MLLRAILPTSLVLVRGLLLLLLRSQHDYHPRRLAQLEWEVSPVAEG